MRQFVVDYMIAECQRSPRVKGYRVETDDAHLRIDLSDGKSLAIYVINRAIRLPEIRETLEQNTRKKLYTMFVIDGRMMPADQSELEPPHWMAALHSLCNGKVYGYWCDGRDKVQIRPIHMDWKWGSSPRTVAYGPEIVMNNLRGEVCSTASKFLSGSYAVADFGEGAFWKKQQNVDEQEYRWSWRQWSYSRRKEQPQDEEPDDSNWNSWEEFERNYGRAEDEPNFWQQSTRSGSSGWSSGGSRDGSARTRVAGKVINPYVVLGIAPTANEAEIKAAYRQKARENHPDLHPSEKEKYNARMADINAAFAALTKQRQRPDD